MVAFKEEFAYLRCDSGQLFEFDRNWLHAAINRAADQAGSGYELAFFDLLEKRLNSLIETGVDNLQLCSLQPCVKHLRCTRVWTRGCDALREEIVCFIRERLTATTSERLKCSLK